MGVHVTIAEPEEEMPDGQSIDPGLWGLVLGGDGGAVLVVEGTPDELVAFAVRVTDAAMEIRRRVLGDVTPTGLAPIGGAETRVTHPEQDTEVVAVGEYVDAADIARQVRIAIKAAQKAQQLDRDLLISVQTSRASLMSEVAVFIRGDKLTNRYLLRPEEERAEHGRWTPDALRIAGKVRALMGPAWEWEDGRMRFACLYFRDGLCAP